MCSALCETLSNAKTKLGLVVDFPQLFTAEGISPGMFTPKVIKHVIRPLGEIREYIQGVHIWGRRKAAHFGNLDDYFQDARLKSLFLEEVYALVNDGKTRYFVPEVNSSNQDLWSIIQDFLDAGFTFV